MTTETKLIDLNRSYTVEEFEVLPQADELYELVEGKLVKKMSPGDAHSRIARRIIRQLDRYDPDENLGILWPNVTFNVGTGWMPIPDLAFMIAARVPPESEKAVKGVPDLVIEVHSPGDLKNKPGRDAAQKKIKDWLTVGVRILWAINPPAKLVEVYHQGQLEPVQILTINDELDGEDVIPGFRIKVKALFK